MLLAHLTRKTGRKRRYKTVRTLKERVEPPPHKLKPLTSILDGSAFGAVSHDNPNPSRCQRACNQQWDESQLQRTRAAIPKLGRGMQTARKTYVRSCFTAEETQLHVRDGADAMPVCWTIYGVLMGVSNKLLSSASSVGGCAMKPRTMINTAAQVIVAWILELASHWELQPDKNEIYMSFPTKWMVYNMFVTSAAMSSFHRAPPVYAYFVIVWRTQRGQIKLKKAKRFNKCDTCVLATEALDVHRGMGGGAWKSEEYIVIKLHLDDHYQDVKMSRQVYMIAKLKAKSTPEEILTIAIDGSDQSSYATPYFRQETKDSCKGWKMRMKLSGALVTGRMLMFFTIASNWETGSNLTIQVLHSTLLPLISDLKEGTSLPRCLHLQMDKCSRVGTGLKQLDAASRSLLGEGILASYKVGHSNFPVRLQHLNNIGNIRDLLIGCMYPIPAVIKPQAFKVSRDPTNGAVKMQVQARSYLDNWGVVNTMGVYSEGYMEIMKQRPDLRNIPKHPRKVVEEGTLAQHRLCMEASGPRIMAGLLGSELPEGHTRQNAYDKIVTELQDSIVDLGRSTSVENDWDLSTYPLQQQRGGSESVATADEAGATDDVGAENKDLSAETPSVDGGGAARVATETVAAVTGPVPSTPTKPQLRVDIGEFVALALPESNPMPLTVGKVLEIRSGSEGREVFLHWYTPKTNVKDGAPRSDYGKGGWSAEDIVVDGKHVPSTQWEAVCSVSATFLNLCKANHKLPSHVWHAIAENVGVA